MALRRVLETNFLDLHREEQTKRSDLISYGTTIKLRYENGDFCLMKSRNDGENDHNDFRESPSRVDGDGSVPKGLTIVVDIDKLLL